MSQDDKIVKLQFKLKIYESSGEPFQRLVNQIFTETAPSYQSIAPYGNEGDGGNDGCVIAKGAYYQVHAPKASTTPKIPSIAKKMIKDFNNVKDKWGEVREYYFVYNDRYDGAPMPLVKSMSELQKQNMLENCGVIDSFQLEKRFFECSQSWRESIVGPSLSEKPTYIEEGPVGKLLTSLADTEYNLPSLLEQSSPDFYEKIQFNGLTAPVTDWLSHMSDHVGIVNRYLEKLDSGVDQAISEKLNTLYCTSKKIIKDNDSGDSSNVRYLWMVEQLIPDAARVQTHSLKAYREAAQIVISKYFETCDVYDDPKRSTAT